MALAFPSKHFFYKGHVLFFWHFTDTGAPCQFQTHSTFSARAHIAIHLVYINFTVCLETAPRIKDTGRLTERGSKTIQPTAQPLQGRTAK